jgi:hypothetical protein
MTHLHTDDRVRLKSNISQLGTVLRILILGVTESAYVIWDNGPVYPTGGRIAYFGANLDNTVELIE